MGTTSRVENISAILTAMHRNTEGYVAIFSGVRPADGGVLTDTRTTYVAYPRDLDTVPSVIAEQVSKGREVYWCAHLLTEKRRIKANAAPISALYADIDNGQIPTWLQPSIVVESSPGRLQGYWFLEEAIPPDEAEELNHRIAIATGADASGWDLTQLLRIPGTPNRKYDGQPIVRVVSTRLGSFTRYALNDMLPPLPIKPKTAPTPAFQHETEPLTVDDETVLRRARLTPKFRDLEAGGGDDPSAGDQSYVDALVGAGASDSEQVLRIWHAGRRWRDKCDEVHYANGETYAQHTAAKAFDGYVQNRYANNEPILVAHESPPAPSAAESADVAYWRKRAETAEALCTGLQKLVDTLQLENAELRQENSTIVNVVTNPHLKAEAPTLIRTAVEVREAKRRGAADEHGFVRINTSKIGDDYGDKHNPRNDGMSMPIRSRATVGRHLKKVADLGLIEREIRTATVTQIVRDPKTKKPKINPETNKPITCEAPTDQTWVKLTGESITDMLGRFAFFRAPETMPGEPAKVKKHGGDRRSEAARAEQAARRTPCPDCGSTERKTYCVGCGCDVTEIAEADETHLIAEHKRLAKAVDNQVDTPVPNPAFQDDPLEKRGTTPTFHLETGGYHRPPTEQEVQHGLAVYAGQRPQASFHHETRVPF